MSAATAASGRSFAKHSKVAGPEVQAVGLKVPVVGGIIKKIDIKEETLMNIRP